MNRQRKVVITITYNEMGIIIDTKAEEVAQPNLQSTCNQLATDCINKQKALDALGEEPYVWEEDDDFARGMRYQWKSDHDAIETLPSAQPEIIRCRNCKFASGDSRICMKFGHSPIGELDFCAWAERRTDDKINKGSSC